MNQRFIPERLKMIVFLTPNVAAVLVEKFGIKPIGSVEADVDAMMAGSLQESRQ